MHLQAKESILIAHRSKRSLTNNISTAVGLTEKNWFYVTRDLKPLERAIEVTRDEFLSILADVKHILIKAKYHTIQLESKYVDLPYATLAPSHPHHHHHQSCSPHVWHNESMLQFNQRVHGRGSRKRYRSDRWRNRKLYVSRRIQRNVMRNVRLRLYTENRSVIVERDLQKVQLPQSFARMRPDVYQLFGKKRKTQKNVKQRETVFQTCAETGTEPKPLTFFKPKKITPCYFRD